MCGAELGERDLHVQYYARPYVSGYGIGNIVVWCSKCAGDRAATIDRCVIPASEASTNVTISGGGVTGGIGVKRDAANADTGRVGKIVRGMKERFMSWAAVVARDVKQTMARISVTATYLAWCGVTTALGVGAVSGTAAAVMVSPWYVILTLACSLGLVVMRSIARTSSLLPLETVTSGEDAAGDDGGSSGDTGDTDTDTEPETESVGVWESEDRFVFDALALRIRIV
jgi:hypothetical protein